MKMRTSYVWEQLRSTYWFIPMAMVVLVIVSLAVLITFIHHVSASIQAENVIARVGRDLDRTIERLFAEEDPASWPSERRAGDGTPQRVEQPGQPVPAPQGGHLQAIDPERLMTIVAYHPRTQGQREALPVPCTFLVHRTSDHTHIHHERGVHGTNEEHVARSP